MSANASHVVHARRNICQLTTVPSDIEVILGAYGDVDVGDRIVPLDPEDEDANPWERRKLGASTCYHRVRL